MAAMTEGTMAAVLGLDADAVRAACEEVSAAGEVVVIGNLNAPAQVVISGSAAGVERAGALLRERGARRVVPLNVSGAFHSPLMAPAAERFAQAIEATRRCTSCASRWCATSTAPWCPTRRSCRPRLTAQLELAGALGRLRAPARRPRRRGAHRGGAGLGAQRACPAHRAGRAHRRRRTTATPPRPCPRCGPAPA